MDSSSQKKSTNVKKDKDEDKDKIDTIDPTLVLKKEDSKESEVCSIDTESGFIIGSALYWDMLEKKEQRARLESSESYDSLNGTYQEDNEYVLYSNGLRFVLVEYGSCDE